ncbi:MAG: ABC transporter substrate-binding protein [Eubacteriaceae bacterium]|jgi:peptide/nickel transport system substrate-binding protein
MKKTATAVAAALLTALLVFSLSGCGQNTKTANDGNTLIYASNDYTRINPALDEHGEINLLIFNGLTAHNADNEIVPCLATDWSFDDNSNTYTFNLRNDVKWQDGEKFTAADVKFTIKAIMNPDNESEIASNYEDVESITTDGDYKISFKLKAPNAAFTEYMSIGILPQHLLEGKDMQTDEYFKKPIGTGPYKIESWEEGQAITLKANDDYFDGKPNIETVIFKIVPDDSAKALQLKSGEVNFAHLTPKDANDFRSNDNYDVYTMQTSDYRGIMYNFNNDYWKTNKDIIPAINYGIDRQAIVDSVLLGEGITAYGPLQRNIFNFSEVNHYDYDPAKAEEILQGLGCEKHDDGFYYRNGQKLGFTLNVMEGDQVRKDIAQACSQQLAAIGIDVKVEVPAQVDWDNQEAFLIGWGSPFDADDHTYKVFGTDKGSNYSAYSNEKVDEHLQKARETDNTDERAHYYQLFQEELADDPAFTFICYIDADYVGASNIHGITTQTILGHHGVGIFWNLKDWTID